MSESREFYLELGPFGTGFWVGYGITMAALFWGILLFALVFGDWSSATAESATWGIIFINALSVVAGISHAESAKRNAREYFAASDDSE